MRCLQAILQVGLSLLLAAGAAKAVAAADYPPPKAEDFVIRDFRLHSGETLPELRLHYLTFGNPQRDASGKVRNAVLILHGTTGNSSNFVRAEFAGELFGPGQLLDATGHYLVVPDNLGHGRSSKPSDGLHARFPHYGYRDMVEAQYRLLTEGLKVNHLRLVMGTSMGGMHTWLWGESHPEFMDALLPLASLPSQISGRNRVWRRMIIDAIRTDPEWQNGDYQLQPHGLRLAAEVLYFMSNNPVQRQQESPTLLQADLLLDAYASNAARNLDANDVLYALEASRDYDPAPDLEKIQAPLLAINFEDDLINPPELGVLEREIKRVKQGKAVVIPRSDRTRGHGTHTLAAVWKEQLATLLRESSTSTARESRPSEIHHSRDPALKPLDLYVAPTGNDAWSGHLAEANAAKTDGPLASLEKARDRIREARRAGKLDNQGATVWIRGGTYARRTTFELTAPDSGTASSPVTYRACRDESVRITGGAEVPEWKPVTDATVLNRFDPEARSHVLQADLRAQGITDFGVLTRRSFGSRAQKGALELFFQDQPMTLARWPNQGWAIIAGTPAGQNGGRFTYSGDRPKRWTTAADLWVHGYWTYDWADSWEKVRAIDTEKREILTEPPHGVYGYTPGKRYFALNLLEELDAPGEWYLDRQSGLLYFWPPAPISAGHPAVSLLETPLVELTDASFVTLRGLIFECARSSGVEVRGGESNLVAGCVFRDLGAHAISIGEGGPVGRRNGRRPGSALPAATHSGVVGCDIYAVGEGGIILDGGDRQTLTPAGNFAINNDIHDYSRCAFTYHPAVSLDGVGNRVAHNRIHDAPHNAILFGGNDHVIEYNDVRRVCLETGDAGAFYTGRNLTTRGTIIRYNSFHDISRSVEAKAGFVDVMSVYLDDCACGTTVYGNVFYRGGRAVMIGGGRDNTVENNIFVDCNPAIHVDGRGEGWMKQAFHATNDTIQTTLRAVPYNQPPYSTRYPHLASILEDEPGLPKYNRILRNICVGTNWIDWLDGLNETKVEVTDNLTAGDPGFVDRAKADFRLRPDSPALKLGFKPLPLEQIGLLQDEYRRSIRFVVGPPMQAKPMPPPPPPLVVPDTDPALETPVNLVDAVRGKHPRLLFSAEDIPAMREFALGEGARSGRASEAVATGQGRKFFETLLGYLPPSRSVPADTRFASDDTEAQRQGMWRLPTVALHYVLTGDRRSFDACLGYMRKFLATEHWQTDQELDSGMGAANVMVGAALVYDWLYHDLDPQFREAYAKRLLLQARRMYYGGHLNRNHDIGYWQQDPQNNHRWHRDAGLALCALGVAGDLPGTEFIVAKTFEELKFVNQWLPPDGTCHESPSYMIFGGPYLILASQAADRCPGSAFLALPYYKNNAAFRIQTLAPGMNDVFGYGDFGGFGFINNFLFKEAAAARDKDLQTAIMRFYDAQAAEAFMYGWFSLLWYDPSLAGGAFKMPNQAYYEDLGLAFLRDGWAAENVGLMFKCGPYGGYKLNEYRNANDYHGINVAHDDPDANTFDLYARGQMLIQDGGYAAKKLSSSVNTILVNGRGQKGEGEGWTQPLLAWKPGDTFSVVEGEAAGAYADLTRYRRTVIFAPAGYVLILDDIRAAKSVEVTWLAQSPKVQAADEAAHRFRLAKRDASCDLQMASDRAFTVAIGPSTAESHGRSAEWQQLQANAKGTVWRLATVFNAWNQPSFSVALEPNGDNAATVRVTAGDAVADTWTWAAAPAMDTPSSLTCRRKNGSIFECGPADKASLPVSRR
jgi:homoserine acetyltransferase